MSESRYKVFLTNARRYLAEKDFTKFMENIAVAKFLAEENSQELAEVLYTYIRGLYDFEDYKAALEQLGIAIPLFDGEEQFRLKNTKGIVLGKLGALEDAIELFEEISLLKQYPGVQINAINNLAWGYIYKARETSDQSWLERAISKCNGAINSFESVENEVLKKRVMVNLGTAFWYQGDYEGAVKAYKDALDFVSDDPKIHNNLASAYSQLGDYESFSESIEKAIELAEQTGNLFEEAQNWFIRGEESERKADYYRAIEHFSIAYQKFAQGQASLEMKECRDKIAELRIQLDRENREIEHSSLAGRGLSFGEEFKVRKG